jgi:formylglycine-generating enzyme required for sulfatase activity
VVAVLEWGVSRHSKQGINCQACHGASKGHVVNERNEVKPDRIPHGAAIASLCATCHASGCPKTRQTTDCQSCHHVHALVNPKQAPPGEDPDLARLYARREQFQRLMAAGDQAIQQQDWRHAQESFRAALTLIPGDTRATAKLRFAQRRLHPGLPGFEIVGSSFDPQSGLPKEVKVAGLGITMVAVPAGECDIGSDEIAGAQPVNTVRVEAFYLGKFELTQAQWKAVMGENPALHQGESLPVERVSWTDCQVFIQKLNARVPGGGFRLPNEAEWEYAFRGGSSSAVSDSELSRLAWFRDDSLAQPLAPGALLQVDGLSSRPVGTKEPNAWGFHDMYGNVAEWCSSLLKPYPYDPADGRESPTAAGMRVVRGGGFADSPQSLNPALRHGQQPDGRLRWNGLRLARTVPRVN